MPKIHEPRPPAKIERVLARLLQGPATTRELEHVGDHVGHSTASDLRRLGVVIESELIRVPGYAGSAAWVARYTIRPDSRTTAEQLLERMRSRRFRGRAA